MLVMKLVASLIMLQCGARPRVSDIAELDVLVIGLPGREAARLARVNGKCGAADLSEFAASTQGRVRGFAISTPLGM